GIRDGHVTGVQTCALPIYRDEATRKIQPVDLRLRHRAAIGAAGKLRQDLACRLVSVRSAARNEDDPTMRVRQLIRHAGRAYDLRSEERRGGKGCAARRWAE